MIATFLCGCKSGEILNRDNTTTMDSVRFDAEGHLICADHGLRRAGWLSLPIISDEKGKRPDWSVAQYTPLEIEALVLFGELPARKRIEIHDTEDKRFNDDPEMYGQDMLAVRAKFRADAVTGQGFYPSRLIENPPYGP